MDIKKILSGIAVIIDDNINDEESGDLIIKIKEKLVANNIPFVEYNDIPDNKSVSNFNNVNFVLLDWQLFDSALAGTQTEFDAIKRNIKFIRKLRKFTFAPIFIFTNQSPDDIINILKDKKLYKKNFNNYIFVKRKQKLFSKNDAFLFFNIITQWLKKTPSIYVLKKWEQSLNKAKRDLFWSFYEVNHNWPAVLQKSFTHDGSDINYELGNFIFKNTMARTEPIKFDETIIQLEDNKIKTKDIRKILEAERFIKNDSLPDIPFTGDLYKLYKYELSENGISEKEFYFLNIRPECDIAHNNNPEIYCVECEIVNEDKIIVLDNSSKSVDTSQILFKNGSFIDKIDNTYLPFVFNQKIMVVKLKDLKISKWKQELFPKTKNGDKRNLYSTRIGRILPPYITKVQQRYSYYLQRQGLPAIPKKAIE
jgi:hypothetical protein